MLSVENVATPPTAATVVVPERVPPAGFVPIATVTLPVKPGTTFPEASCAVIWSAGVIAAPAVAVEGSTVKTSRVAVEGTMSNGALVAPVRPVAPADNVYPVPALSMPSEEKVATPPIAASVVVPDSAPPAGFVPIATVTLLLNPGTLLLMASSAATSTGGATCAPAVAVVGCIVKASCVAAPGLMSNGALVAPPSPVAVADSVYPVPPLTVPVLSMLRPEKVATPPTAATVFVPDRVAPAAPVPGVIVAVTLPAKPATVLPSASCAVTWAAGVIVAPAVVLVGWSVNASRVAVPLVMVKGALVAALSPVAVTERA